MRIVSICVCAWLVWGTASLAHAANWNEAANGDLSGNRNAPTLIALGAGANTISATSVAGDLEYFRLTLPAGARITSVTLSSFSSGSSQSFVGVQAGTTFTEPPTGTVVSNLLGYVLIGSSLVGTDILDNIGAAAGTQGFTGALTGSNYTFWTQEDSGSPSTYTLTFNVATASAVPAMPLSWLSGLALCMLALGLMDSRKRAIAIDAS